MQPGIAALFEVAGRTPARACAYDLGFVLGPRLNAAGRLTDMSLGIECLITDDPERAQAIARELDRLNRERREIEADMQDEALAAIDADPDEGVTLCMFDAGWHQGVVGIVASRLKDRFHRPVIAFARGSDGEIKGSGRSIPGLHLRDALDLVAKRHPGSHSQVRRPRRSGGRDAARTGFRRLSRGVRGDRAQPRLTRRSGAPDRHRRLARARRGNARRGRVIADCVWGQGFPEPQFFDRFDVVEQRVVGGRHSSSSSRERSVSTTGCSSVTRVRSPPHIEALYRLGVNEFNGTDALQLTIQHWRSAVG